MFIVYVILLVFAISTYVWAIFERFSYTSQVCSGDLINDGGKIGLDGSPILLWEEMVNDFYLISCGRLLKYFVVIESLFMFCCVCSSSIWVLITPNSMARFTTPVEYTQTEH